MGKGKKSRDDIEDQSEPPLETDSRADVREHADDETAALDSPRAAPLEGMQADPTMPAPPFPDQPNAIAGEDPFISAATLRESPFEQPPAVVGEPGPAPGTLSPTSIQPQADEPKPVLTARSYDEDDNGARQLPDCPTVADEQRLRSAAIHAMGVEEWKDRHDERPPEDVLEPHVVPGVGKSTEPVKAAHGEAEQAP